MRFPLSSRYSAAALPALVGGVFALLFAAVWSADPLGAATTLRERALDALQRAAPRAEAHTRVVVVDIDARTVAALGGWPLPRGEMARLLTRVLDGKPAVAAFDIFFAGPDRGSLQARALRDAPEAIRGELATLLARVPDPDQAFSAALAQGPSVLAALAGGDGALDAFNPIRVEGALAADAARSVEGVAPPYEPLASEAFAVGVSALFGEEGGVVRRAPLLFSVRGRLAPGLALEAARVAQSVAMLSIDKNADLDAGVRRFSLTDGGALRLRWSDPQNWARRTVSAIDVLSGAVAAERFARRAVIIGASAPEAGALRPTPLAPLTPSAQIQAEALEQLLAGVAPQRTPHAAALEALAALLLGLGAAAAAARFGPGAAILLQLAVASLWIAGAAWCLIARDLIVDPIGPPLAAVLSGNVAAAASFARTRRLKALISRKFEQYIAADVVREILAHPERLRREGEMRVVTALFTDIESFTPMTQRLAPRELIALLDRYLGGLARIVTDHGGMLDGFTGDAIHAFFNVPLERATHADDAIACAKAIIVFSENFRKEPRAAAAGFGRTRIGVETGPAIVGDVGGEHRLNYTAYGDAVIVAARLEPANKEYNSQICIGPGAAAAAKAHRLRPLGRLTLKGRDGETTIYTPAD